ncbi:expressed unknown protein [Seminavis robusta]|uniref:Uncharacterized protein n=1 Tax=Seminavis robusta TaxID=568900 RepID=A0A9N8HQZ9_9STRA|nr:expressed unknown protein [Seminavis robusta]|eukprot:Sro1343_g264620.1 n/a (232) ;mRNA; r:14564-15259
MLSHAVQRNNAAVQLLQNCRYSDASVTLQVALTDLQLSFRATSLEEDSTVMCMKEGLLTKSPASGIQLPVQAAPIQLKGNTTGDSCLELFARAFCLSPFESRERIVSSVLLYNCGLASHCSGVLRGNSKNLMNAMRLYKYACRILLEVVDDDDTSSTELLRLALFNNISHVCFQLCHLADAQLYVKCLRDEMGLSDDEPLGAALPTVTDDDYDFFCFNVTIRVESMGAPAA